MTEKSGHSASLPAQHRALVLQSPEEVLEVKVQPVPEPLTGSAILRILSAHVISYAREILQASDPKYRNYPFPHPNVPGFAAIGRVAAVGNDATVVKPGQLVFFDPFVRARDLDGSSAGKPARFLSAIHDGGTEASRHFMANGGVRDGSWAEYLRAMLENCYILDEARLTGPGPGGLGYSVADLNAITTLVVPYGGLRSVDLRPGETILISPATGPFGGAACMVALAMGAKVIAWGRDVEKLDNIKAKLSAIHGGRYAQMIETVPLTADADTDLKNLREISKRNGGIDVFFDIAPPEAQKSHHLKTGMLCVRHSGRVSLMSGFLQDYAIPFRYFMHSDLTIKGKWMYERSDVIELIKMIERGLLAIGERGGWEIVGEFGLEDWKEACDTAWEKTKLGEIVVFKP